MARMTPKKTNGMIGAIYFIVFFVMNFLIFLIFDEKNGVFWTSYAFMCIAFIVQIVSMFFAVRGLDVEAIFFGIPLATLSLFYFFAAVFTATVFMIFQNAPMKLAVVLQVLILAIYAVVAIIALMSRDVAQDVSDNVRVGVTAIKTMQVDVEMMMSQAKDATLKNSLRKLSETIRYSDPMSNDAVINIEDQIMQALAELRVLCENNMTMDALNTCKSVETLFMQRNRLLKATK